MNITIAGFRADHVHHTIVLPWLEQALSGSEPVVVPDLAWVEFTRIVTNGRIFDPPSSPAQAFDFVNAVCEAPSYIAVPGLADGIGRFERAAIESDARGNLLPDAYIAAIAFAHGASVASLDRDFRRFDGLRIVVPAEDASA